MPLRLKKRGEYFYIWDRIDEIPGCEFYRQSTGETSEGRAQRELERVQSERLRRHFGGVSQTLTFGEAIEHYTEHDKATPKTARYLEIILERSDLGGRACAEITGAQVRALAAKLYPQASVDTWHRQVSVPVSAVINFAHQHGKCPPIRIKRWGEAELVKQDIRRGKDSRPEKIPGDWDWIEKFRAAARALGYPQLATMALFMFLKGRRLGTMIALEPDHLNLSERKAKLRSSKGRKGGWVDLPLELVVELANLEPKRPRAPKGKPRDHHRLKVFGFAHHWSVYKPWRKVCAHAGIDVRLPHAAGRHGYGTETISRLGLDPASAAKEGDWANPAVMLKIYAHPVQSSAEIQAAISANRTARQA